MGVVPEMIALGPSIADGFVVVPGPLSGAELARVAELYDAAMASAEANDLSVGRTTDRLHLLERRAELEALCLHPPLVEAARQVIGGPCALGTLLARTLRPHMPAQELHADCARDAAGWPMLGFIFMVDPFRTDNGATRFVPGSHERPGAGVAEVAACGPAGSMILYNGAVLHGHGANHSAHPRRSIQGAYLRA